MLITAGVVSTTLYFSYEQLKMQRELWVEEHRPKIYMKVKEAILTNDTIFVKNEIKNYGLAASTELSLKVFVYDAQHSEEFSSTMTLASSDPERSYEHQIKLLPSLAQKLTDTFYLQLQMNYGWLKDSNEYKYDASYRLEFDSATSKYRAEAIAESRIPKKKK